MASRQAKINSAITKTVQKTLVLQPNPKHPNLDSLQKHDRISISRKPLRLTKNTLIKTRLFLIEFPPAESTLLNQATIGTEEGQGVKHCTSCESVSVVHS